MILEVEQRTLVEVDDFELMQRSYFMLMNPLERALHTAFDIIKEQNHKPSGYYSYKEFDKLATVIGVKSAGLEKW
jgi:hypothetical protein